MIETKRGQSAAGAAVLIAIIAGLLVMFIILISPQERARLLDGTGDIERTASQQNLLTVTPGTIDFLVQKEVEHPLPVINVFTKTESRILAQRNVAKAKNGVFTEEVTNFPFTIPDVRNTKNVLLSFKTIEVKGRLVITLNGEDVFDAEVVPGAIKPITLPANALQESNSLIFTVSSPGLAFWQTNAASLEEIKVVADVTSLEAQSSRNIFLISETEKKNLERAVLRFQPECNPLMVGKLLITINGQEMYNALQDCDLPMITLELSPDLLQQGENEIIFSSSKGTYQLSRVSILSTLRELDFPTYYFDLSHEEYEDVRQGKFKVRLRLDFVDVVAAKRGELTFNGHLTAFDTKEVSLTLDISEDIVQGSNVIKIKPKRTLEIRELRVDMVK